MSFEQTLQAEIELRQKADTLSTLKRLEEKVDILTQRIDEMQDGRKTKRASKSEAA